MVFPPQEDFSRIIVRKRATAAWRQKPKRGKDAANYDKGAGGVGKVVEVYWEGEGEWFRGRLTRYRDADGKHRCDYEDGDQGGSRCPRILSGFPMVMWCYHHNNKRGRSASRSMVSCQKLGVLVWAKTGKYPWWPAETCLASRRINQTLPAEPLGAAKGRREGNYHGFVLLATCRWMPWMRIMWLRILLNNLRSSTCRTPTHLGPGCLNFDVHKRGYFGSCFIRRRRRSCGSGGRLTTSGRRLLPESGICVRLPALRLPRARNRIPTPALWGAE